MSHPRTNLSTIAASFVPRDYRLARFAASLADADQPLPKQDDVTPKKAA